MRLAFFRPAPDSVACRHVKDGKVRYTILVNLFWTFWIFADVIFKNHIDGAWILATSISVPVFLLLYFIGYLRPQRQIVFSALAMAMLGYVVMPWNHSGGTSYIIYACAYLAFFGSTRQSIAAMLLVLGVFAVLAYLQHWPWGITAAMIMVASSVGGGNLAYGLNAQKDAALRLSHDEVRKLAASAERERIGRDLHDLLGHTLSMIALKSELARKLFERDPQAARREIADVERIARDALAQVRHAVSGIRAAALAGEVASARLLLECANVRFKYDGFEVELPVEYETCLALALREAVTNIQRHADATHANAELTVDGEAVQLSVLDNGRGVGAREGNGLSGMRERVAALGGRLQMQSPRAGGTLLTLRLPLHGHAAMTPVLADVEVVSMPLRVRA